MKKIVTGASILLTGALLFLSVFVASSSLVNTLEGWDTRQGRFWTAVSVAQLNPILAIGIVMMLAGIALLIWGNISKTDSNRQ